MAIKKGNEMKAIDGRLRVDQSYEMVSIRTGVMYCENCGNRLTNIAVVRGSEDNREYEIGLDCASTLRGIQPDKIKQAKKLFARKARVLREIKNKVYCKAFVFDGEVAYLHTNPEATEDDFFRAKVRGSYEPLKEALEAAGVIIIHIDK